MSRRVDIQVVEARVGENFLFTVTGGKAHIGAIATAGRIKTEWFSETMELPGHKEGPLATVLAEYASEQLHAVVSVVVGIHLPNATKEEIVLAVEDAEHRFKQVLSDLLLARNQDGGDTKI